MTKMGIEAFMIASAVDCVVAQRLARKLCPHCKRRTIVPPQAVADAGIRIGGELEAYEPLGCARCNQSGYKGRVGLYSVMAMSERLKGMAVAQMPEAEIGDLIIEVRSATAGVGSFKFKFDHMAELTGRTADQIVAARRAAE